MAKSAVPPRAPGCAGVAAMLLILSFLVTVLHARYQACAPGRYGPDCSGICSCGQDFDCNDGPAGDGLCVCHYGRWRACGEASPLVATPPSGTKAAGAWPGFTLQQRQLRALRVDRERSARPRPVWNASLSHVLPTPFQSPRLALVGLEPQLAARLGLDAPRADDARSEARQRRSALAEVLSGRRLLPGSEPYAHCYGGHQFGHWAGQLGDGRAITIGEAALRDQTMLLELSLKGSGRTPFSRAGDGRAVLRSLCREFLAAAALRAAGVPTVASLALVASPATSDAAVRDEWYRGKPEPHLAGVLVRASPTFVRVGSLQIAAKRQGFDGLVQIARHVLHVIGSMERHDDESTRYLDNALARARAARSDQATAGDVAFGVAADSDAAPSRDRDRDRDRDQDQDQDQDQDRDGSVREDCFFGARERRRRSCADAYVGVDSSGGGRPPQAVGQAALRCLLQRASARQGALVAAWMSTGFAHGVMNTDNTSPIGLTIDLNVFGWIDRYDEGFTPNHIDDENRYAFGRQREMMRWNLQRLADAMTGTQFVTDDESDRERWILEEQGWPWLSQEDAQGALKEFDLQFRVCRRARLRLRLGLDPLGASVADSGLGASTESGANAQASGGTGDGVVDGWLAWLTQSAADYHRANRALAEVAPALVAGGDDRLRRAAMDLSSAAGGDTAALNKLGQFLVALRDQLRRERAPRGRGSATGAGAWWIRGWAAQVRAAAPRFVFRTAFGRQVTSRAIADVEGDGAGGSRRVLAAALRALQQPFAHDAWRINGTLAETKVCAARTSANASAQDRALEEWLLGGFGALSPRRAASRQMVQTSCGGQ